MTLLIVIAVTILAIATLLPVWRNPHWLVRGMDFPRLQLALFASFLLVAELLSFDPEKIEDWALTGVTLICLAWHLWWILPYTVLWRTEVKTTRNACPDRKLSIITANVLTPNRQADVLLRLVNQYAPDVLVTLESDHWWQSHLGDKDRIGLGRWRVESIEVKEIPASK